MNFDAAIPSSHQGSYPMTSKISTYVVSPLSSALLTMRNQSRRSDSLWP